MFDYSLYTRYVHIFLFFFTILTVTYLTRFRCNEEGENPPRRIIFMLFDIMRRFVLLV